MSSGERAHDRPGEPAAASGLPEPRTAAAPFGLDAARVISLQRTAGNAAVSALMKGRAAAGPGSLARLRAPDQQHVVADAAIASGLADTVRTGRDADSSSAGASDPFETTGPHPASPTPAEEAAPTPAKPTTEPIAPLPLPGEPGASPVPAVPSPVAPAALPAAPDAAPAQHAAPRGRGGHAQAGSPPAAAHDAPAGDGAPAAGGSPELDSWKAAVSSAAGAIADPQLGAVTEAPAALAGHAAATEHQRAGERPDFPVQARAQLPPEPKAPAPAERLDTKAADAALAAVEAAGTVRLSDQVFPPMAPMPGSLAPPHRAPTVPPAPTAEAASPMPAGPVRPDPTAHAVAGKIGAVGPVTAGKGPADAVPVSDPGAASLDALPAAQATHIGDVAARVLADAPAFARQLLDAATATLDPARRASLAAIAERMLPAEQDALTAELGGVAAAAGVSAEQLQAKVAAKHAAAAQAQAAAAAQLDERAAAAKHAVTQRGSVELQAISGAGAAVREEVTRKQEAAKGASDPSVIDARRDVYLEQVVASAAASAARLRSAKERRVADLQRIAGEQKGAHRHQVQRVQGADAAATKIAARPPLDWVEQQSLEVDGHVARLSRLAGEEVQRRERAIKETAATARDQIRDWAAEKQGRQRTWWERLRDMLTGYASQAVADNKAWEAQRNAELRDKVASDLTMLAKLRDDMAAGNRDAVLAELARMSNEERAVVQAFLKSGGRDAIGAVAAGLVERIKGHRVPELSKRLEQTAIAELGWEELDAIGAIQTPGFDAALLVREIRGSVKGWGTKESRLFAALGGRTALQIAAMRKAYANFYHGRDMDKDIDADVSGSEQDRADALRTGDPTAGAVATLRDAIDGAGTSEATIMQTLRGKTPAQRDAIVAAYEKQYGVALKADLKDELGGYELGQADALLEGDTTRADAIAVKDALAGAGTDEAAITAVYARIRDEVEAKAGAAGMKTAEIEAEIKRRTEALKRTYGSTFAQGDAGALEADYRGELSGGELNLALAAQAVDQPALDAATLQVEHESAWTSDEKVNEVLRAQHSRAEKEVMRDLAIDFNAQSAHLPPTQRKAAWEQMRARGQALATERSKQYMAGLEASYNHLHPNAFKTMIEAGVSGHDRDEAHDRIASGGKLSDAKELKYSIHGLGTKEQRIRDTLKGKSKQQIADIRVEYEAETGEDLVDDLTGDLSGRDEADMTRLLETGDSTPEEKLAYLRKRKEWELGEGTGVGGDAFADDLGLDEEAQVLSDTTQEAGAAYENYAQLKAQFGDDDPRVVEARERLERWVGYGEKDIERHREELDSVTDTIALAGGIAVGIAVTAVTGGLAAAPIAAAWLGTSTAVVGALAGALAATAAGMLAKQAMKGDAYGGEDIVTDLAQGTADAIVATMTLGAGAAVLKLLARTPALSAIARAAESGLLKRLAATGAEGSLDGLISGLPSGMMAAILDESTWKDSNPLATILNAGKDAAVQGAQMGGAVSVGQHAGSSAYGAVRGGARPHTPTRGAVGDGKTPPLAEGSGPTSRTPESGSVPGDAEATGRWERPSDGVPEPIHEEPSTEPQVKPPVIEESPPGGFEPTTREPPPEDPGPEPIQEEIEIDPETASGEPARGQGTPPSGGPPVTEEATFAPTSGRARPYSYRPPRGAKPPGGGGRRPKSPTPKREPRVKADSLGDHLNKRKFHGSVADLKQHLAQPLKEAREKTELARPQGAALEVDGLIAEVRKTDPAFAAKAKRYFDAIEDPRFLEEQMAHLWEEARDHNRTVADELEHILGGGPRAGNEFRNTPGLKPEDTIAEFKEALRDPRPLIDISNAGDYHGSHTHAFHQFLGDRLFGPGEGLKFRQRLAELAGPSKTVHAGAADQYEQPFWSRLWDQMFDTYEGLHSPEELGQILQHHLDFPRWDP